MVSDLFRNHLFYFLVSYIFYQRDVHHLSEAIHLG